MSSTHVAAALRRLVSSRAMRRCEYCLIHEDDTFFGCEVDHVISEKHGGLTAAENLAHACFACNRRKGSDIGSIERAHRLDPVGGKGERQPDHRAADGFAVSADGTIETASAIGAATVRLLHMNSPERKLERAALLSIGRYPGPAL